MSVMSAKVKYYALQVLAVVIGKLEAYLQNAAGSEMMVDVPHMGTTLGIEHLTSRHGRYAWRDFGCEFTT